MQQPAVDRFHVGQAVVVFAMAVVTTLVAPPFRVRFYAREKPAEDAHDAQDEALEANDLW